MGRFPFCQRFRKFRSEGPFRFLMTGIIGIHLPRWTTYLISLGVFRPIFAVPFLINLFFTLIREFEKKLRNGQSHSRINWKMSFHFHPVFPLIFDLSVWHNVKHPCTRQSTRAVYVRETTCTLLPFPILPPPRSFQPPLPHRYVTLLSCVTWLGAFALCFAKTAVPVSKHYLW